MSKRIGIDVGGTNVKIALVDNDGKIIYSNTPFHYKNTGYGFCRIRCFKLNILLYFAVKILLCYLQLFL